MAYQDPAQQREAQRRYANECRATWLAAQVCRRCGRGHEKLSIFTLPGAKKVSWSRRGPSHGPIMVLCPSCQILGREELRGVEEAARRERKNARERHQAASPNRRLTILRERLLRAEAGVKGIKREIADVKGQMRSDGEAVPLGHPRKSPTPRPAPVVDLSPGSAAGLRRGDRVGLSPKAREHRLCPTHQDRLGTLASIGPKYLGVRWDGCTGIVTFHPSFIAPAPAESRPAGSPTVTGLSADSLRHPVGDQRPSASHAQGKPRRAVTRPPTEAEASRPAEVESVNPVSLPKPQPIDWGDDPVDPVEVEALVAEVERPRRRHRHNGALTADEKRMMEENERCMATVPPCPVHGRTRANRANGRLAYRCCGRAVVNA